MNTRPYYGDRITPGQTGPHPDPLTDPYTGPMAILHWDFASPYPGVRIKGSTEIRSASDAAKIRDLMNSEHGDGTHWVETLNYSWEERHAVRSEDS